jgi:hypothetical protein
VKYSIVIPTRDNGQTIGMTIESCLLLNYHDFEVIIQDNSSNDETAELVAKFADNRIKYFRNSSTLHMTENWNLAINNSSGDWVILLGGDDAIRRDALLKIDEATNLATAQSVTWSISVYTWDDFTIKGKSNLLSIPPTTPGFKEHETRTEFNNLLEGKFSGLPSLYYGCIKRDLIDNALQSGPLLDSRCPDLYSASLFGLLTETFIRINNPLTIAGFSGKSSVTAHLTKDLSSKEIRKDTKNLRVSSSIASHKLIPELDLECTWVLDSLLLARDRLKVTSSFFDVTPKKVSELIVKALQESPQLDLKEVRILKDWCIEWGQSITIPELAHSPKFPILPLDGEVGKLGNFFVVNCRDIGVKNILEALDFLDMVERVSPLLEMAQEDLVERVEAYENQLLHLRSSINNHQEPI